MQLNDLINIFISLFNLLLDTVFFGIPLLIWFMLPFVIGLIFNFIGGKK